MAPTDLPRLTLRAAQAFDGDALVDPPLVEFAGSTVVATGTAASTDAVLDLGSATVMPGFVDCHQHLVFDGVGTLEEQVVGRTDDELRDRARRNARQALEGGVTTVRDLGDRSFVTLGLRDDPDLPRILCSGPPITPVDGHCWYLGGECADVDEVRAAVRERIDRGCDVVKIMATGGALTPAAPPWASQYDLDVLRVVVADAHAVGVPVAAHAHGTEGIEAAMDAGVDTIEHCTFLRDGVVVDVDPELLDRLAASGVAVSATIGRCPSGPALPEAWAALSPGIRAAHGRIHRAGGSVVVGSDAGISTAKPHDVAPLAMKDLLDCDMTPLEALHALTAGGADVLGVAEVGRLRPGADADLVVVGGDPLDDAAALTDVRAVWRRGRRIR